MTLGEACRPKFAWIQNMMENFKRQVMIAQTIQPK